jgi:multidrug resistance efflux pump
MPARWACRAGNGPWAVAAVLLLAAALWPTTFRVVAPARVEGLGQQVLAAPLDGFVASATLRPGAAVKAGQVLMALEDKDLSLDAAKWQAELAQLDKKYREAQTTDDAAAIVLARAKLEQTQAQLDLVLQQLDRIRLKAPFDGVLLSGDYTQAVGAPVKRGQELMTVAPARQFRIVAEVDEQDIARLRTGQQAQVLFGAFEGAPLAIEVTRVAPIASVVDGRNVFEVDGRLTRPEAAEALRAGLRGVVRIDIEPRLQGWVWWHRASQWTRRLLWRFIG